MKSATLVSVTLAALFGAAVIGCDDNVAEEKKVDVKSDGTVVTEKETVKEKSDGTIVHEKTKDVDKPADDVDDDKKDGELDVDVDVDEK